MTTQEAIEVAEHIAVARSGGGRGFWRSRSFALALLSLGLSGAALYVCSLHGWLLWKVLVTPGNALAPLVSGAAREQLTGLLGALENQERVFVVLALGFAFWALRRAPRWPAYVALLVSLFALVSAVHLHV